MAEEMEVEKNDNAEPMAEVQVGDSRITLLGTAHISRTSADKVKQLLESGDYDAVAVELCPSRHHAIVDPDALSRMDLFEVIRSGKASMVAASLALGAFQQRASEQLGMFQIKSMLYILINRLFFSFSVSVWLLSLQSALLKPLNNLKYLD